MTSAAPAATILVVEDDAETRKVLTEVLAGEGHRVTAVAGGLAGTQALRAGGIAGVVLDVWLPDANGVELCREWRRAGMRLPILMLTARTDVSARVQGLDAGADDYLGKPFALAELRARMRALLRRGERTVREQVFELGRLRLDFGRRQAWLGADEVPLTRRELDVLERLFAAKGHAVAREDLLEEVWGEATPEAAASLEVIVARLRRKLEAPAGTAVIRTLRGFGYALSGRSGSDAP